MLICRDQRTGAGCGTLHTNAAQQCQTCGRSLRFALRIHDPDTLIRHYRIRRMIGYGGFGAVYEAEDLQHPPMRVALKETFDPTNIRGFQGEFAILQHLQHPNLPHYVALFEEQGDGYLVMEFVPGQSLQEILDKEQQPLSESQVLGYAVQLCDVLTYLHQQMPSVIHRDIKPANIRLTPNGLIKLVDFGLLKQGTGSTQSSRMGLTPAYAPLEQYGSIPDLHTDPRSDLYSLGATLYHLITNVEPVPVTTRIATPLDALIPPQQLCPQLTPHVATTIMKALQLRPHDRYASVNIFKQALMGATVPNPTGREPREAAPSPGAPPQVIAPRGQGRSKTLPWTTPLILGLIVIGLGLWAVLFLPSAMPTVAPSPTLGRATPTVAPSPTLGRATPTVTLNPASADVRGANPTIVNANTPLQSEGWSYDFNQPTYAAAMIGNLGHYSPKNGRFVVVLVFAINSTGIVQPIPGNFFVIKDAQGRIWEARPEVSAAWAIPGQNADLAHTSPLRPDGITYSVPIVFDVAPDTTDLVLFARSNPSQGWLILRSV